MDWTRRTTVVAAVVLLLAMTPLFSRISTIWQPEPEAPPPPVRGTNSNVVLFFALAESGQINAQLAATQGLLERYPDFEVHFASFSKMEDKIARVSQGALARNPAAKPIVFHEIPGPDRIAGMDRAMNCSGPLDCLAHPPGAAGSALLAQQLELALWPWTGEEHFAIFERSIEIVRKVQPAVAVIDFAFRPPLDAVMRLNWNHIIISPLALADVFGFQQPYLAGFWKYPALGTGFSFPVPWYHWAENVLVNGRLIWGVATRPQSSNVKKYLEERGITWSPFQPPTPGVPFITQTLPEASIPVEQLPEGVVCAGAILLDNAPAMEQDPELVEWVLRAPTVVVNLGSLFKYTPERAAIMAQAIKQVLDKTEAQVLWKVAGEVGDDYSKPVAKYLKDDRLKIFEWLPIDLLPLLKLKTVIASVHHGGSSSFNEAMSAGAPQVIMPIWEDHYNFAQLAEDLGLGIYATRGTSPDWTLDGIVQPILRVVGQSEEGKKIRAEATRIGEISASKPGRYIAADEIAKSILDRTV